MPAAAGELGLPRGEGLRGLPIRERVSRGLPRRRGREQGIPSSGSIDTATSAALTRTRELLSQEIRTQQRQEKTELQQARKAKADRVLEELNFPYDREPADLLEAIHEAEDIADKFGFRMLVVGGAGLVRYIDGQPDAQFSIDHNIREVTIAGAKNPGLVRKEDGTVTDIDTIVVRKDAIDPFTQETREDYETLKEALAMHVAKRRSTIKDGHALKTPSIGVEPMFYHPPFAQPGPLQKIINLNSRIDVFQDDQGGQRWEAVLSPVHVQFKPDVLQTWRVKFADRPGDRGIPTLMPPAYYQRFFMRGPTIKEKDKAKTADGSMLKRLVDEFYASATDTQRAAYKQLIAPWQEFTRQTGTSLLLWPKRRVFVAYWNHGGEQLAHEKGFLGEILQPLIQGFTGEVKPREAVQEVGKLAWQHLQKRFFHQ